MAKKIKIPPRPKGISETLTAEERRFVNGIRAAELRWHPNLTKRELTEIVELQLMKRRLPQQLRERRTKVRQHGESA